MRTFLHRLRSALIETAIGTLAMGLVYLIVMAWRG